MASTSWTFGPYTATWDGVGTVTVTVTATGAFVSSFAGQSLASLGEVPQQFTSLPPSAIPAAGLSVIATTGQAGFALQNATPILMSWTTPSDGSMHRFLLYCELIVNSAQTGGAVSVNFTDPGGTARVQTIYSGGSGTGLFRATGGQVALLCAPNTAVSVQQSSAQTAGASILWAEIWGL